MEIGMYMHMDREDIIKHIPYALVAETFSRECYRSGRGKRIFQSMFPTEQDRERAMRLVRQSKQFAFRTGAPEELKMTYATYLAWMDLARYCFEVG